MIVRGTVTVRVRFRFNWVEYKLNEIFLDLELFFQLNQNSGPDQRKLELRTVESDQANLVQNSEQVDPTFPTMSGPVGRESML